MNSKVCNPNQDVNILVSNIRIHINDNVYIDKSTIFKYKPHGETNS